MSVTWFDPEKTLPEDQQECLLMPHDHGGLVTIHVYGPIRYDAKLNAWFDLFSSSQAGEIVSAKDVGCWTPWEPIAPPDDLPTERP